MPAAIEIKALEEGLYVLDKCAQIGRLTSVMLAQAPGWDRVKAWRYLEVLTRCGYLEKIGRRKGAEYILGRKFLERSDLSMSGQFCPATVRK